MSSHNSYTTALRNTLKEIKESSPHNKYWNISWKLGEKLSELVSKQKPSRILEIGTSNGFSTLWLVLGSQKGTEIHTIEVDERRFAEAQSYFDSLQLEVDIIQHKSGVFELLSQDLFSEPFDFIFIDAAHRRYTELVELLEKKNLVASNGMIVADNVISHTYMGAFVERMELHYDCEVLEIDSGFLIARSWK